MRGTVRSRPMPPNLGATKRTVRVLGTYLESDFVSAVGRLHACWRHQHQNEEAQCHNHDQGKNQAAHSHGPE